MVMIAIIVVTFLHSIGSDCHDSRVVVLSHIQLAPIVTGLSHREPKYLRGSIWLLLPDISISCKLSWRWNSSKTLWKSRTFCVIWSGYRPQHHLIVSVHNLCSRHKKHCNLSTGSTETKLKFLFCLFSSYYLPCNENVGFWDLTLFTFPRRHLLN